MWQKLLTSTRVSLLSVLFLFCLLSPLTKTAFADNLQFCNVEQELQYESQKPIFESDSFDSIRGYLGLDLRESVEHRTKNYIFFLNFRNNHTLIISQNDTYMFVGVNVYSAYMITKEQEGEAGTWRLYQVEKLNKDSTITKLFFEMKKEWIEYIKAGCPKPKETRI